MAFLILAPSSRTSAWEKEIRRAEPDLDLRVWPDTGDPDEATFALCWKHPPGVLNRFSNLTHPKAVCPGIVDNYRRMKSGLPLQHLVDRKRGY